jgi:sugar/nucleoside kinase (ribokinase family)
MVDTPAFDILMTGHFAKDLIVIDGQSTEASGGGVYYGSMALQQLGKRVAVVTRAHPDDFHLLDEMTRAGIRVHAHPAAQTSGIENSYSSANMERRQCRTLGFAGPFSLEEIPDWPARIRVATPIIAGEFDLPLVESLAKRGPLAMDVQGFVRVREGDQLVFRDWPDMARGLAAITYLKVDLAEAELLTGKTDAPSAARALAAYGPREIVLTQTSGLTVLAEGRLVQVPFRPRSQVGRTGRGDTCFSTYLGMRLCEPPDRAAQVAAAITSLKQEKPGPWRGSLADADALIASGLFEIAHGA